MPCTHDKYRGKGWMMASNALKAMKRGQIIRIGKIIKNCEQCGADISHAKRVQTWTYEEWL